MITEEQTPLSDLENKVLAQMRPEERERIAEYEKKCTSCGACCSYYAEHEGAINADGPAGEDPKLSYHKRVERRFKWPDGTEDCHIDEGMVMRTKELGGYPACAALEGQIGKQVACTIYQIRPLHCRLFVPGSNMCLTARKWAGLENG